jgi:uncharacterized protein YdaU (DUF1376 family)
VNYYEHHLGDWAQATAHLSFVEDAAYSRLIRKYYSDERPLPADIGTLQRLVGARTREERQAVETVLREFFALGEDGWRNKRCDEELARFQLKRTKAQRSANARWQRAAEHSERNANAMRTHSEGNALQSPVTSHQSPEDKERDTSLTLVGHRGRAQDGLPEPPDPAPTTPTMASAVCVAMRAAGLASVNPGHPKLLALLEASAPIGAFVGAAQDAAARGKGFAYALAIVEGQLAAAKAAPTGPTPMRRMSAAERAAEAVAHLTGKRDHLNFDRRTIDVESNPLG